MTNTNKTYPPYCTTLALVIKFSGANGDREKFIFPFPLITSRIGNLTRLIHTSISDDYTYMHTYIHIVSGLNDFTCVFRLPVTVLL